VGTHDIGGMFFTHFFFSLSNFFHAVSTAILLPPPSPPVITSPNCLFFCLFVSSLSNQHIEHERLHILLFKLILLWHNFFSHFHLYILPAIFHSILLTGYGVDLTPHSLPCMGCPFRRKGFHRCRLSTPPQFTATSLPTFSNFRFRIQCFVSTHLVDLPSSQTATPFYPHSSPRNCIYSISQ